MATNAPGNTEHSRLGSLERNRLPPAPPSPDVTAVGNIWPQSPPPKRTADLPFAEMKPQLNPAPLGESQRRPFASSCASCSSQGPILARHARRRRPDTTSLPLLPAPSSVPTGPPGQGQEPKRKPPALGKKRHDPAGLFLPLLITASPPRPSLTYLDHATHSLRAPPFTSPTAPSWCRAQRHGAESPAEARVPPQAPRRERGSKAPQQKESPRGDRRDARAIWGRRRKLPG
ncbi:uncharacterized protein LOC134784625 [Penaeus indicus]|uniref:uncharacterized protein LOC134784625 n=1 Tax=Penaeus indicus TaxID=29960 RepID=UPI00300D40C5